MHNLEKAIKLQQQMLEKMNELLNNHQRDIELLLKNGLEHNKMIKDLAQCIAKIINLKD